MREIMMRLSLYLLVFLSMGIAAADVTYNVALDTSALVGHPAGPFSIGFQLTDGSGTGDGNNTVKISNVQFGGGGAAAGAPALVGGAAGSLAAGVTLRDTVFLNSFAQSFMPGNLLTFQLSLTSSIDNGAIPDQFSFSLLDHNGVEIPTAGKVNFDVLFTATFNASTPNLQQFGGDTTRSPQAGGNPIGIPVPQEGVPVGIDIRPGGFPNPINIKSGGNIPVAVLSSAAFNAPVAINRTTLTFGRSGSEKSLIGCDSPGTDVNGDGLLDLVCHFDTQEAGFKSGDTIGVLHGTTTAGQPLQGTDSVKTVP
jgi:hypothetical protein